MKKIAIFVPIGILALSCVPMTSARLTPRTTIGDVRAVANKMNDGSWEICLSLPDPAEAVHWSVILVEPFEIVQHHQAGRANFAWKVPLDRWKNAEPFKARVVASGIDEIVSISHPTRETTISDGAVAFLDVVTLPTKIPRP